MRKIYIKTLEDKNNAWGENRKGYQLNMKISAREKPRATRFLGTVSKSILQSAN